MCENSALNKYICLCMLVCKMKNSVIGMTLILDCRNVILNREEMIHLILTCLNYSDIIKTVKK